MCPPGTSTHEQPAQPMAYLPTSLADQPNFWAATAALRAGYDYGSRQSWPACQRPGPVNRSPSRAATKTVAAFTQSRVRFKASIRPLLAQVERQPRADQTCGRFPILADYFG